MGPAEVINSAQGEARNTFAFEAWSTDEEGWREQFAHALSLKGISFGRKSKPRKRNPVPPWERPILPAKTWEEAFERAIPGRPLCADDFELGVYPCRREYALIFRYIQYNRPTLFRWLIVDIDRAGAANAWQEAGLPAPNLIMENPANGHAHLAWLLTIPVSGSNPLAKAFRFLAAIERGFMRRLDADRAFNMHGLVKNPLHADWSVCRPFDGSYSLAQLAAAIGKVDMKPIAKGEREAGLGRNCALFDWLRRIAYREVLRLKEAGADLTDFLRGLLQEAMDRNRTFHSPLSSSEIAGIVKSVAKWVWRRFSREDFSEIQRARVSKRYQGAGTLKETKPWEAEGKSRAKWFRLRKANGEAQGETPDCTLPYQGSSKTSASLSQSKPWEAEGISRRTWERRRKANGQAEADATRETLPYQGSSAREGMRERGCDIGKSREIGINASPNGQAQARRPNKSGISAQHDTGRPI